MSNTNPVEDLKAIRQMMENSSKFLSLSGLSGIFAGLTALVGAYLAHMEIRDFEKKLYFYVMQDRTEEGVHNLSIRLALIAIGILVVALVFAFFFTWLKARKNNQKLWSPLSFRLVISMLVPLAFGGIFILGLFQRGYIDLIGPATLIFYGMGLLNASKYVHVDIKYLALSEMALGTLSLFLHPVYTLWIWAFGFGVLHILYGTIMYFKYDYKPA